MITTFSKGFYKNHRAHDAFRNAVAQGDCREIAVTAAASEGDRSFVDAFIHASPRAIRADQALYRVPLAASPQPDTSEFVTELEEVQTLSEQRDTPLDRLSKELPRGFREVSPILNQVVQMESRPRYRHGEDFMTAKREWSTVQEGKNPREELRTGVRMAEIVTGRDAAAYVHKDSPLLSFLVLAGHIFSSGFEVERPDTMADETGYGRVSEFVTYGQPFVMGVLGEVLRQTGNVSFWHKWTHWFPRPEEVGPYYDLDYISQAFPEGSPMHPARCAMHSAAALALAYALIELFRSQKDKKVAFTDESLEESALLLADNVGYFRVHAGVHYRSDHTSFVPVAQAIAGHVVSRFLGRR